MDQKKDDNERISTSITEGKVTIVQSMLLKAVIPQKPGVWNRKTFPEVLYWAKQVISLLLGILWGCLRFNGYQGILTGIGSHLSLTFWYTTSYCHVNLEEYPPEEVVQEGAQPAAALFLLMWVLVHTFLTDP